ncbi:MAG: alpha/beta hydrolase [Candidatus Hydrogenedentales bacterium]
MNAQRIVIQVLKRLPDSVLYRLSGQAPIELDGRRLDAMAQVLWAQGKKERPLESRSPEEARAVMSAALGLVQMRPRQIAEVRDISVDGTSDPLKTRLYVPHGAGSASALLLWFHQGGCVIGDLETSHPFCTLLAERAGCRVLSVDYRLAPEHKFPAAAEDAIAAYEWAASHADEIGADASRIAVGGDSAGGYLSAVITHAMRTREDIPRPVFQLLVYPWVDAIANTESYRTMADAWPLSAPMMAWFADLYLNDASEAASPLASPLRNDAFDGLPPAYIATAGFDPLRNEGELYAEKLRAAGVPVTYRCYDSLPHGFASFAGAIPAAERACGEIADVLAAKVRA